jgi:hypothetical protein
MIILNRKRAWNSYLKQARIPFPTTVSDAMKALPASNITVVAYHTNDAFYTQEAKRLCASAARLNIPMKITVVEDQGGWVKNTSFKSAFLKKERAEIRGAILYVDVDAVFHRSPLESLVNLNCDIAVCYDVQDKHLMSGTLFLQDTPEAMQLMTEWNKECQQRASVWDQRVLQDILINDRALSEPLYRVSELPIEYCWIFDRECNLKQNINHVYIEHLQASRSIQDEQIRQKKFRWLSLRKKSVQRRIDRVTEVETILFPK